MKFEDPEPNEDSDPNKYFDSQDSDPQDSGPQDSLEFDRDTNSPLGFADCGLHWTERTSDDPIDCVDGNRVLNKSHSKSDLPTANSIEADSVVVLFQRLSQGDEQALHELWNRFFQRLAAEARSKLNNQQRRVMDEDDLAANVLHSLCVAAENSTLPAIRTRDDLWRMLLSWIRHDVLDHIRFHNREKRGGGLVRGDSVFAKTGSEKTYSFDDIMAPDSASQALIDLQEAWQHFSQSLQDEQLRLIALRALEGATPEKIAEEVSVSPRTIERKIQMIRQLWSERERFS
jgi:DNA-directed RNA polymerase specialized sigma24 family protein